jgi:hypothetical protein
MNMSTNGVPSVFQHTGHHGTPSLIPYLAVSASNSHAPVLEYFPVGYAETVTEPGRTWRRLGGHHLHSLRQGYANAVSRWRAGQLPRQALSGWLTLAAALQRLQRAGGTHAD